LVVPQRRLLREALDGLRVGGLGPLDVVQRRVQGGEVLVGRQEVGLEFQRLLVRPAGLVEQLRGLWGGPFPGRLPALQGAAEGDTGGRLGLARRQVLLRGGCGLLDGRRGRRRGRRRCCRRRRRRVRARADAPQTTQQAERQQQGLATIH